MNKINIAYNKSTQQFVGYTKPAKDGVSLVVLAYSIDELVEKFNKTLADKKKIKKDEKHRKDKYYNAIQYFADQEENETKLMILSSKGLI